MKVELTFLLSDQLTCDDGGKRKNKQMSIEGRAKPRTEPAPSTGEWPRQSLPASRPPIRLTLPTRPPRQTEPPRRETIQSPAMPTIVYQRHEMAPSSSPTVPPVKMPRRDSPDEPMLTDDKPPTTTTTSHPCQNQLLRPNRRPQHLASHGPVNTPFEM